MNVRSTLMMLALFVSAVVAGCGGSCPECNCPVCPQVQTTPPPVANTGPCTEEWVHMPVLINFPTGGAELDAQNRAILGEVVRTAQSRTDIRRVRVEGHTDTCGSEVGNMALSQGRAETVAIALVELGVPREMLETVGFGSTQPRANEACEERRTEELSRQTNRRVEFSILVCREGTAGM
ncbi:MAG: OmpA family protein [Sandaracinaceae bacterium]|nr:OmpA family protein [Sandaracinaceae bacterium]